MANVLAMLIQARGLSEDEVLREAHISVATLRRAERGGPCRASVVADLARALSIQYSELRQVVRVVGEEPDR